MAYRKIEDIEAWRLARELAREIWNASQRGTFNKDFRLKDQINAAAGSTMDNIAEGFGRGGNREFVQFLAIARGSAQEVKSQLIRAHDRQHLNEEQFQQLFRQSEKVIYQVHHQLLQVQNAKHKGAKYKSPGSSPSPNLEDVLYPYGAIYATED